MKIYLVLIQEDKIMLIMTRVESLLSMILSNAFNVNLLIFFPLIQRELLNLEKNIERFLELWHELLS